MPLNSINPYSRSNRFRAKRTRRFVDLVQDTLKTKGRARILDLGGTKEYWSTYGSDLLEHDVEITIANLDVREEKSGKFRIISGDATNMNAFPDDSFDFVHSNSVIEHVGHWQQMDRMAREVRRLAPSYFIQTPYFWFPIEPHFRTLFFHWFPEQWRYRLLMGRKLGFRGPAQSVQSAMNTIQSVSLLDRKQFLTLFPDAEISFETVALVPKSMVAVRKARQAEK